MRQLTVLIAVLENSDGEANAIRQVLESFGVFVMAKYIGRPKDFMDILAGDIPVVPDYLIISGHGEGGGFQMPVLGREVYCQDEPRGAFGVSEIQKYLKIQNITILSTACTTGCPQTAEVLAGNHNRYLAPDGYIEGDSALFFVVRFFTKGSPMAEARKRLMRRQKIRIKKQLILFGQKKKFEQK